jgi:hypothetical protein
VDVGSVSEFPFWLLIGWDFEIKLAVAVVSERNCEFSSFSCAQVREELLHDIRL